MYISESDKERILRASEHTLLETIQQFTPLVRSGVSYVGKCPLCDGERSLTVTPGKGVFKCFKCNQLSGKRPVDYLMKGRNMSFPEALEHLARNHGIILEEKALRPAAKPPAGKTTGRLGVKKNSFCARMLAESGLTYDDVAAKICKTDDHKTVFQSKTFRPGSVDEKGNIIDGDDVIIEYYDLDGNPVKYELRDKRGNPAGKFREYFRVRWQFPDEHRDKTGRPAKYRSPYGTHTYIYIPQFIRDCVREGREIPHLFIQEGEKKAEKACRHNLPSIAVSGIQNLGTN